MKIYNVKENAMPRSTMYSEEIDVVLAVAEHWLKSNFGKCSIILKGQPDGEMMKDLLQFDAGDGTPTYFSVLQKKADHLIDQFLDEKFECAEATPKIIYRPNSTAMLILPTTYGVFLCSVATIKRASIDFSALLVVIARALHRLSEGDTVLKASYDIVYDAVHTKHKSTASTPRTEEFIDALFEDGNIPEIEAWKYWHRENNDLALFFEEG